MAKVVPFPRPEATLAVFWRTNGEWYLTEIDASHVNAEHDAIVRLCIEAEQNYDENMTDEAVQTWLLQVLDKNDPEYTGYEISLMVLSTDAVFFK